MRTEPEALTIAYIAIGAHRRLRVELNNGGENRHSALIETYGGELGIIDSCIHEALTLDRMQDEREAAGLTGNGYVFAYEVAEEYGYYLVDRMLTNHAKCGTVDGTARREIAAFVFEAATK